MPILRTGPKLLLTSLVILSLGLLIHTQVSAQIAFKCRQVSFTVDGRNLSNFAELAAIKLQVNSSGGYIPKAVRMTITVEGDSSYDLTNYRLSYDPPDGGWTEIGLAFEVAGTGTHEASAQFNLTAPGEWVYEVETKGGVQVIGPAQTTGGRDSFCPLDDSGRRFTVSEDTSNVDPTTTYVGQSCLGLNSDVLRNNHFTCEVRNVSGQNQLFGAPNPDDQYCQTGFSMDFDNCGIAKTATGADLPQGFHCMPCVNPNAQPEPEPTVVHRGICVPNSSNPDEQCQKLPQLSCLPANFKNEAQNRCIYRAKVLAIGAKCYPGADECANSGPIKAFCKPDEGALNPNAGTCELETQQTELQCVGDRQCTSTELPDGRGYPPGTKCIENICHPPGSQLNPIDDDDSGSNAPPTSNDFGIKNCPHFYTSESVAKYQTSRSTNDLVSCRDVEPGTECTVLPSLTSEELAEANSCKKCIETRSSWTALGCINTTPEGLLSTIIRIALGVVGGVALIRLIILGYLYNFGREDQLKPTVQDIMSTLGGILLVLFSVLILRFIGVNVLDVVPPGFFGS